MALPCSVLAPRRSYAREARQPLWKEGREPGTPASPCAAAGPATLAPGGGSGAPAHGRVARKAAERRAELLGPDGVRQRAEPLDLDRDLVARLHEDRRVAEGADAGRRAGGDQV